MLTILAALNDEVRLIKAEMEIDKVVRIRPFTIFTGKYQNRWISLVITGVGKEAMKAAITYCTEHQKTSLLLNVGYAGGLDPHTHPGDIVIANTIIDERSEKSWDADDKLVEIVKAVLESAGIRHHIGKIVTVDEVLSDPHQKAFMGTRFEAVACDMESAPFAEIAQEAGKPFLVVRSILDPLDTPLPNIPEDVLIGGKVSFGRLASHLKSNPKDILKLPKFSYLCNQARISMTNFVKEWIKNEQSI